MTTTPSRPSFAKNSEPASHRFEEAIDEIYGAIVRLQMVKDALLGSGRIQRIAKDKAPDVTIKKLLTRGPRRCGFLTQHR
jgi:hypothetical protein